MYFQVQTIPNAGKMKFSDFHVLVHGFLVICDLNLFFVEMFLRGLIMILLME